MLPVRIRSTACCIPSLRVDSTELDRRFGFEAGRVEALTGIRTRYYSNEAETAPYLGAKAALQALRHADLTLRDVDALIALYATSPQLVPCAATLILRDMGELDAGIEAFDVGATCLSFIAGLDVAAHLIAAGRHRRILLVAVDACSPMLNPKEVESASLIGDGAAAILLERAAPGDPSSVGPSRLEAYPRGIEACQTTGLGTTLHPKGSRPTSEADAYFHMDGQGIFRLTYGLMPRFMERFSAQAGVAMDDVDLLIPHQASGPAVRIMIRRFVTPAEERGRVFLYLGDYGNVGAASIPLGIHLAIEQGRMKRGDRVLLVGTGAGLQLGASLLVY